MKKAFLQVMILLIFTNVVVMIRSYNKKLPEGYQDSKAVVMFENFKTHEPGLGVDIGTNNAMFTTHGSVGLYIFTGFGDFVNVHYKMNKARTAIIDAYITDWNLVPFRIDKMILEFFASLFLFGILTRRNREKGTA